MTGELRRVGEGELESFGRAMRFAFGQAFDPAWLADLERALPLERTVGHQEDGAWVGGAGAFPFRITVPGGELAAAGVTVVWVAGTHRRRGLLGAMMERLVDDAREREEPLAVLWASGAGIYGRHGFGMGAPVLIQRIARAHARLRGDLPERVGRVVGVPADAAAVPRLEAVYARERAYRPGAPARSEAYWRHLTLPPEPEETAERRLVVFEGASGDEGYALHTVALHWDEPANVPDGTVTVIELVAATPAATAGLWAHLLDVDLMERTVAGRRPPDDPLPQLLADPGRLEQRLVHGLWVRLLDVPHALAGRRYAVPGRLVLDVAGEGSFLLEGGRDGAECVRTGERADLALPLDALGALYLGGVAPAPLLAAGRLEERTPGAARSLHAMFASPVAPWCPFPF